MRRIIHKYILKNGDYHYLCNQTVRANWLRTDISNRKVSCKNCLCVLKKKAKEMEG